jgi:hypothetical protein
MQQKILIKTRQHGKVVRMDKYKSGQKAPQSGDYRIVNSRGQVIRSGVTLDKGDSFPPTPGSNQHFEKE